MAQIKISGLPTGTPNNDIEIPATNPNDLATPTGKTFKYYLTDLITFILKAQGFNTYSSCRVATTLPLTAVYANGAGGVGATLTNSGAQAPLAIDGVTLSLGDRVLVKDQAASAQNGIYFVSNTGSLATNWVLTRATDFDQGTEIIYLGVVAVNQGATNAGIIFQETSEGSFNIGTSAITFAPLQVSSVTQKQVQESAFNFAIAGGVNNVFTVNLLPDATAYTDGLLVTLSTGALTNTIGNPTLNVNGLGAKTITFNGLQLEPSDIEPNATYVLVYDLNNDYFNIINPSISIANTRLIQFNEYNAAIDSGVVNAYVANITPPIDSLTGFLTILCGITNANTGASTLTVNGQTASIVTANNQPLVGGELIANQNALFIYDASWGKFILVNPSNNVTTLLPVINHRLARFDGTSGRIQNSSATLADSGVLTLTADAVINTVNIGLGAGSVATNTRVGVSALGSNTTGARNVAEGYQALTTSTTASDNTAIGYQAGTSITGSQNVAIGSGALTNGINSGSVAIGYQASSSLTTGAMTAIGYQAGKASTTGYNMVLVGSGAGVAMTTGNNVVAVGNNAFGTATTGGSAVAVGISALGSSNAASGGVAVGNSAGSLYTVNFACFVGTSAGQNITTGGGNTIMGSPAGQSLTTGANNTIFGYQALNSATTSSGSTALGYRALANNTAANNTAVGGNALENCTSGTGVAVGKSALGALTTGTLNVAVGTSALASLTTGAGNTAVGTSSLSAATTTNFCTAVGQSALAANTANDNTAFGHNALAAVTSGYYHTAVGRAASQTITTNLETTAVGYGALALNTAGNNTAIGSQAMLNCTTGTGVAVGKSALGALTTGTQNTAVGTSALSLLTTNGNCAAFGFQSLISATGGNNTAFGILTGNSGATGAVTLTTGTSNTMLGYRACPNAADAAGTISIGADAVAAKATGATSGDDGPGIAIGSASYPVGFRGDGMIYPSAGAISGYMQVKINGTAYKLALYALS